MPPMPLDIPSIARSAAQVAFNVADSVMIDAVLHVRPGAGTVTDYDATTDLPVDETEGTYNIRGLKYQSFSRKNTDDSENTASFLVRVDQLAALGLTETPNDADYIMIDGIQWNVVRVDPDPALAVYIFQMHRG